MFGMVDGLMEEGVSVCRLEVYSCEYSFVLLIYRLKKKPVVSKKFTCCGSNVFLTLIEARWSFNTFKNSIYSSVCTTRPL